MLERKNKKQLVIDYQHVFNTEAGKRVLEDLKKQFPLMTSRVNPEKGVDVNRLLVMTGERNVLLYIYNLLSKDPFEEQQTHAIKEQ